MKKFMLSIGMILASAILIAACETTTTRETASGAKPKLTDSELETKIKNGINTDEKIREADLSVKADADDNEVTIFRNRSYGSIACESREPRKGSASWRHSN